MRWEKESTTPRTHTSFHAWCNLLCSPCAVSSSAKLTTHIEWLRSFVHSTADDLSFSPLEILARQFLSFSFYLFSSSPAHWYMSKHIRVTLTTTDKIPRTIENTINMEESRKYIFVVQITVVTSRRSLPWHCRRLMKMKVVYWMRNFNFQQIFVVIWLWKLHATLPFSWVLLRVSSLWIMSVYDASTFLRIFRYSAHLLTK